MKRKMSKTVTFLLAVVMGLTVFSGCDLVTVDSERNLNQVIATVSVGDGAPVETIRKKEMIYQYISYGWYYVYQQQYTAEQMFEQIFNSIISNKIYLQTAMNYFNEKNAVENAAFTDVYSLDRYLSADEIEEAVYNTNHMLNESIESYVEKDEEETDGADTSSETARTVPANATNFTKELKIDDWRAYNKKAGTLLGKGIDSGFTFNGAGEIVLNDDALYDGYSAQDRKNGYNAFLNSLDNNGLLDKENAEYDFKNHTLYDSYYYEYALTTQKEGLLLEKWNEKVTYDIVSEITFDQLAAKYSEMYKAQKASFDASVSDYGTALDSASASAPVVYNPYDGYGYVYNLLLGADDIQTLEIGAIDASLSKEEKIAERNRILAKTTVKDQRSSWITSGYDSEFDELSGTVTFKNDYAFYDGENPLSFKGTVNWENYQPIADRKDDYKNNAQIESVAQYSLQEFIDVMDVFLYGAKQTPTLDGVNGKPFYNRTVKAARTSDGRWDDKVNDLLYAFSTDPGSLGKTKGYLVKPFAEQNESETYVAEFQTAAKEVLRLGAAGFGSSYIVVATDFGYHVILYSQSISKNTNYETLTEYLNSIVGGYEVMLNGVALDGTATEQNWKDYYSYMLENVSEYAESELSDFFLYTFQQSYASTLQSEKLSDIQQKLVYDYKYRKNSDDAYERYEDYVKIYADRFDDLFKFED